MNEKTPPETEKEAYVRVTVPTERSEKKCEETDYRWIIAIIAIITLILSLS